MDFFCLILGCSSSILAQNYRTSLLYSVELYNATERPKLGGIPDVVLPKAAIKNGVEGTLVAVMNLAKDGKVKDLKIEKTLPFGIEQAFLKAMKTFRFQPAKRNGEPIDSKFTITYNVSAVYDKRNKKVKKPKITDQPKAVYPASLLSEGRKDSVFVDILFNKDGTVKVTRVNSSMPKEFDKAAAKAAEKIKFEPAMHKKSKKPVSMMMTVEYKFKP